MKPKNDDLCNPQVKDDTIVSILERNKHMKRFLSFGIVSVLALLSSAVLAGAVGGPRSATAIVFPERYFAHRVAFRGGEQATLIVRGDGSTDLDCYVFDSDGDLIAADDDATDHCIMRWYPYHTDVYTLKVVNRGQESNFYHVRTN